MAMGSPVWTSIDGLSKWNTPYRRRLRVGLLLHRGEPARPDVRYQCPDGGRQHLERLTIGNGPPRSGAQFEFGHFKALQGTDKDRPRDLPGADSLFWGVPAIWAAIGFTTVWSGRGGSTFLDLVGGLDRPAHRRRARGLMNAVS